MDSRTAANDPGLPASSSDAVWQVRIARTVQRERNRAFRYGLAIGLALGLLPTILRLVRI